MHNTLSFVNVAFGVAARKASRHQLHKHVNAHVCLGVLAYYAKQRSHEYVCAEHRVDQQVDRPQKSVAQLRNPRFGVCNLISGFGYHLIQPLEARIWISTICTTRCGFVNVVFGFAARKASRHQLHKHVSAHVYLGVLAYYAKQRPSRCWGPHAHVDKPFAWHNFRIPRFGKPKSDLANWWIKPCTCFSTCMYLLRIGVHTCGLHGRGPGRHLHVRAHARYTRYRFNVR